MPVYALYVPTARRPVSGIGMERFASRELTGRVLKERNATGRSRTFYVGAPRPASAYDWPVQEFRLADETGYMRVFLRYAGDPVPGLLDEPDEEWIVREGGPRGVVVRIPWVETGDALPVSETPAYEVRSAATVKPVAAPCKACHMVPSLTGRCGCS